jgi:glutathione S-transferase
MEYISVAQAQETEGLRLILCAGTPGIWGEAVKAMMHAAGIDYIPVAQSVGLENPVLQAWTGQTSAPVIVSADDQIITNWENMIWFIEEQSKGISLVPADPKQRVQMFGLIREIAGQNGIGWMRRLQSFHLGGGLAGNDVIRRLSAKYGYSDEAVAQADTYLSQSLALLADQLKGGSGYYFGDAPTALDYYSAVFIGVAINPLGDDIVPMPEMMRAGFSAPFPFLETIDPVLF